jgi:hypothetical protein
MLSATAAGSLSWTLLKNCTLWSHTEDVQTDANLLGECPLWGNSNKCLTASTWTVLSGPLCCVELGVPIVTNVGKADLA